MKSTILSCLIACSALGTGSRAAVSAEGTVPASTPASTPATEAAFSDVVLVGSVLDADGKPVAEATVWTLSKDGTPRRTNTDAKGKYALVNVPKNADDRLGIWAGSSVHFTSAAPIEISCEDGVCALDFAVVAKPSIAIELIGADGKSALPALWADTVLAPLIKEQLQAAATAKMPGATVELPAYGRFAQRFGLGSFKKQPGGPESEGPWGTITLDATGPALVSLVCFQQVLATEKVSPGQKTVRIRVEPKDIHALFASVRAQFTVGDDNTLLSGRGSVVNSKNGMGRFMMEEPETDDTNTLHLTNVMPGTRWISFRASQTAATRDREEAEREEWMKNPRRLDPTPKSRARGWGAKRFPVTIPASGKVDLGQLKVEQSFLIAGTVKDADGNIRTTGLQFRKIHADGTIDPNGGAVHRTNPQPGTIAHLDERAEYLVEVTGTSYDLPAGESIWCGEPVRIDLRQGSLKDLDIRVQKATLVAVTSPTQAGRLRGGLRTRISDENGIRRNPCYGRLKNGLSAFHLAPGNYTITLERDGKAVASKDIEVGSKTMTVVFEDV